jgi:hypothetical protein
MSCRAPVRNHCACIVRCQATTTLLPPSWFPSGPQGISREVDPGRHVTRISRCRLHLKLTNLCQHIRVLSTIHAPCLALGGVSSEKWPASARCTAPNELRAMQQWRAPTRPCSVQSGQHRMLIHPHRWTHPLVFDLRSAMCTVVS